MSSNKYQEQQQQRQQTSGGSSSPPQQGRMSLRQSFMKRVSIMGPPLKIVPTTSLTEEEEWDADVKTDLDSLTVFKDTCVSNPGCYTEDDEKCFARGLQTVKVLDDLASRSLLPVFSSSSIRSTTRRAKLLLSSSRSTSSSGPTEERPQSVAKVKTPHSRLSAEIVVVDGVHFGRVTCLMRASATDILASHMQCRSSKLSTKYERGASTLEVSTLEVVNNHRSVFYFLAGSPPPFQPREFVGNVLWRREEGKSHFFIVEVPGEHEKAPISSKFVRAKTIRTIRLLELSESPGVTQYTLVFTVDLKGSVPSLITSAIVMPENIAASVMQQKYFMLIKPAQEFDEKGEDAAELADHLVDDFFSSINGANRKLVLSRYFVRAAALRPIADLHPAVQQVFAGILSGKIALAKDSKTMLSELTGKSALAIGQALSGFLFEAANVEAGVELWLEQNDCIGELVKEFPYVRQMILTIAHRKMRKVMWGLLMRVILGAFLSIIDMVTDVYAITMFFEEKQEVFAKATLLFILLNQINELYLVIVLQNRRETVWVVLRECFLVMSCLKPAIDAYSVCTGTAKEKGSLFDPSTEMFISKLHEVIFESLPAAVLQAYAFIISEKKSYSPLVSILASILSIAYTTTLVSYDKDVDPASRASSPDVYGAIPASGRSAVFLSMFVLGSCTVLMKVLSTALLASIGSLYVIAFVVGDMILYLLIKISRDDLRYWINLPNAASLVVSVLVRILFKVMCDFTCFLQGKHPLEQGGLYFSLSIFISHASCFVAAHLYINVRAQTASSSSEPEKFSDVELWAVLVAVELLFILSLSFYLLKINRKYVKTFLSTMTGKQYCVYNYRRAKVDRWKMDIFSNHPSYYASIRDEIKAWIDGAWEIWHEERPEWFTAQAIATIPDDFIPTAVLVKLHARGRRKSSLGEQLLLGAPAHTSVRAHDAGEIREKANS